jgi:hypothetical protein
MTSLSDALKSLPPLDDDFAKEISAAAAANTKRPTLPTRDIHTGKTPPYQHPVNQAADSVLYAPLREVLDEAYAQSATGKGRARHVRGGKPIPFDRQPILEIARMVGPGFGLGQVIKKSQEAAGMIGRGQRPHACAELLGAIVYAAATIVALRELDTEDTDA